MNKINILIVLIFTLVNYATFGQTEIPSNFIETKPPLYSTSEHSELNQSRNEFKVKIKKGKLKIKKKHMVQMLN